MRADNLSIINRRSQRQLLIENKLTFNGPETELSIYDTYRKAMGVGLNADQLLYCAMVSGRKVMHHAHHDARTFLPHESYVMLPGESVEIDFPEASEHEPTTCLTIEISRERVGSIADRMRDMNLQLPFESDWQQQRKILHTHHTTATQQLLEKLVGLFLNNDPDMEIMVDLGVSELVTRILREQGRDLLLGYCHKNPDANGLTAAIHYLETHLTQALDVDTLCRTACMSRSRLYVAFRKQLDCTPGEFHLQLRLKSAAESIRSGMSITHACYNNGFNDLSHFSRRFSEFFGCAPSQYRKQLN